MTVYEQIVFKTAFIIFVVTKFLAPQSVNNHISIRFMKALVDVENIRNYNWTEFVLYEIKDAAAALQHKIRHRKSIGYINGCIIVPQVFYLDSLDFGTDTPVHGNIPRIGLKIWVHISQPVPMSLSLHDIQQVIRLDTQMQEETFNVAVQVLAADEIQRFGGTDFVGWRHFLNQDFAMFATAGDDLRNPEDHLPSFKDDSLIPYDVPSCHLIFIPLLQPLHYSLYAFDMDKKNYAY
uniref:Aminotransferase-like plant mobile domain-containing protein n=1 Tax=Oryza punctata TaxID=4537 RepID=A0A0E0JNL4_ORYPU